MWHRDSVTQAISYHTSPSTEQRNTDDLSKIFRLIWKYFLCPPPGLDIRLWTLWVSGLDDEMNPIKCTVLCVEWFCIGFRFYLGCKHRLEIKKFARLLCWPIQAQCLSREEAPTNETVPVFWWEIGPGWGWVNLPFLFLFQPKTTSDSTR